MRTLTLALMAMLATSAASAQSPLPVPKVGYAADRIVETENKATKSRLAERLRAEELGAQHRLRLARAHLQVP